MTDVLPLVTWAVTAYNQASLVEDAIDSAFAQDYPHLEIILSDDCSSDGTFEVIERKAAAYRGPHRVQTNRNPANLYIGGHISLINRLATGELVINAAGDDTSVPQRASRLVEAWLSAGRAPGLVHSSCYRVEDGHETLFRNPSLEELKSIDRAIHCSAFVIGATAAWDRRMFAQFGDLRANLTHEDHAILFRSLLLDRAVAYVDEPLVFHVHGGLTSYAPRLGPAERKTILTRYLLDTQQKLADLKLVPRPRLEQALLRLADYYRAALSFEAGRPSAKETARWARRIGVAAVARLIAKRALNQWRDRRETNLERKKDR